MEYSRHDIERLFGRLNDELARRAVTGEVYVLGGAVMCLVFDARASTRDIDAFFHPAKEVRAAARSVAAASGLPDEWLNDAVKGYLSHKEDFSRYLDLPNLRVLTASPEYLLAMKCLAMRLGRGSTTRTMYALYVVDPRGRILAEASGDRDELVVTDLDLDTVREVRDLWQFFRDRRPPGPIVDEDEWEQRLNAMLAA